MRNSTQSNNKTFVSKVKLIFAYNSITINSIYRLEQR